MQNYPTQTIHLNQHWYEQAQDFPTFQVDRQDRGWSSEYQVVDVVLESGRKLEGLLLLRGDGLLIPETENPFRAEEIEEMTPTPEKRHPDFEITEPEKVWDSSGSVPTIDFYSSHRLRLFGPEEEDEYRSWDLQKAWKEALQDHRRITIFEETGPTYWGINKVSLVPGGMKLRWTDVNHPDCSREEVIQPWTDKLWAEVLDQTVEIHPDFQLRDLLDLLDLPPQTDHNVYLRVMNGGTRYSFQAWVQAGRREASNNHDIEYLEVFPIADRLPSSEGDDVLHFTYDVHGIGPELSPRQARQRSQGHGTRYRAGERITWSLMGTNIARLLDKPIRYQPEVVIPVEHEQEMAWLRGEMREWHNRGEPGSPPEKPYVWKGPYQLTLRELIKTLLWELPAPRLED